MKRNNGVEMMDEWLLEILCFSWVNIPRLFILFNDDVANTIILIIRVWFTIQ